MQEQMTIRGFGRVQLVNDKTGKIEGDSGWRVNAVTQIGFQDYLAALLGATSGSKQATILCLASQTDAGNSTQTSLIGEFGGRKTASRTVVSSKTMRMTANWATDEATESELGGIGAYNTTSGGSVMNALTYATSQKTTDQQLNATLEFRFS